MVQSLAARQALTACCLHACVLKTCGSPSGLLGRWTCHALLCFKSVNSPPFSRDSGQVVLYTSSAHRAPLTCARPLPPECPSGTGLLPGAVSQDCPPQRRVLSSHLQRMVGTVSLREGSGVSPCQPANRADHLLFHKASRLGHFLPWLSSWRDLDLDIRFLVRETSVPLVRK